MLILPLLAGVGIGVLLVAGLSLALVPRESDPTWRGRINAVGAGIVLGVLLDLLPIWFEMVNIAAESSLHSVLTLFPLSLTTYATLQEVLAQVAGLVSMLAIIILYLRGNALPMAAEGDWQRERENAKRGQHGRWRTWLAISAVGEADWKGVALITFGLATHNLWLGQMRSALIPPNLNGLPVYFPTLSALGALRSIAVLGLLIDVAYKWQVAAALAVAVGMTEVLGISWPAGRNTLLLGILPIIATALVLPVALGRMLRRIQRDIGLGWRTTVVVLAAMLVTRQVDGLMLWIAQTVL